MSGTNILPGAHGSVVRGTINAARIVRENVRFYIEQADGLHFSQINNYSNFGNKATSDAVISLVPNPSTRFIGRTDIIAKLKDHFSASADDGVQKRMYFLLHGMGGIGKTQICLKFIEEMSNQ